MTRKKKRENGIPKEIESGAYRDCYLVYNRKSLDEPNSQKNSIQYQRAENRRAADRLFLPIASVTLKGFCTNGIVSEKHSGFKETDDVFISDDGVVQYRIERPKFQAMLHYVSRGHFKGIICLCWDRISRNRGDDTIIRKLMRKGVEVHFAYAAYDNSSAGELHMDIDGMFAQHHSRVTSEKVKLSTKNSRAQGKCTYRAPIGYLNVGTMDHKPLDPERAPIIREVFELYATGEWSLADLARYAREQNLTTVPMRRPRTREEILADEEDDDSTTLEKTARPITENHISRILNNPFYTGRVLGPAGSYVQSTSHEALVADELFAQVQASLKRKTVSVHYTEKLDHPLRGMVRCAYCERVYTPYEKKGILYFNARCRKGCANTKKNCSFDLVAETIRDLIAGLHFTEDELAELDARAETDISLLHERRVRELERIERKKKALREKIAYLDANRLSLLAAGAYTPEGFVQEQQALNDELRELRQDEEISDTAMRELLKEVVALSELLKNLVPLYDFAGPHEKEQIVRAVFSELFIAQDRAEYKLKKGLEAFESRFSALCDPIAWLSELHEDRRSMKACREALSVFAQYPPSCSLI